MACSFAVEDLHLLPKHQLAWRTPSGGYRFSDTTDPNQMVLFQLNPDFEQLRGPIESNFAGRTVGIEEIEDFVVVSTAFRKAHLRKNVLLRLEDTGRIEVTGRRRRRTYPAGSRITFP